ncbi:hypothetical protein [Herbiconiux liangxiaofengii]|uniref:hypothetical protein n=1 Tax=Herbiconiux liangxiaofengii TaxID=3342795 RepID=UPI0035B934BA
MNDDELTATLGAAVLEVPGVLRTYDARPVLVAVVSDAATALRSGIAAVVPAVLPTRSPGSADPVPDAASPGTPASPAPSPATPVVIGHTADGLTVTVSIGVSEERPAAATCRDVYSAVAEALAAQPVDEPLDSVSVQISHIG